ncbi:hypothetical protein SAMN06297280_2471 [Arsukibacterium tuosuense]|uniref:Peptidase M1 membrane alanine aminopeptidase domain-containing protein n=1 Tax=Arsukibacterium tuosuense TaxID=1323745 RepID=A0A285J0S5_9GAMM|nr:hypothetical protein [Arsukibacterium tuosuense]SNY53844.1 hypothetical protein SAMN06297280_2471 [Arsukibacterium tuosuense]
MRCKINILALLLGIVLQLVLNQANAEENDFNLHIHVHYQQEKDLWQVNYVLPIAVDHVAFSRNSNFDRRNLYHFDPAKFVWDKAGDVLLIRSIDGSKFTSLELSFNSYYDFIQKDYTHNIKYTDGSTLLYTNHLTLGANIIEDKAISPIGASFSGTRFHFYAPNQNIIFLGQSYQDQAQWVLDNDGTYIYFGNITPIETDNMLAIVDPDLPKWVWHHTQQYFPKLFDYYQQKTGQPLDFKPVVFFNYDQLDGDYSNYSGGTLDGLVQLTINGKRWNQENNEQFNTLFHFLAHEVAHFWNGEMFAFEEQNHAWMHEGGADAFANFAMLEFGLIDNAQMLLRFEEAANNCVLNKGAESLEQSAKLWRYRNYYNCGAAMALASHLAIQAKSPDKSVFNLWQGMFKANAASRSYNQQDYFDQLSLLTGSKTLAKALARFSHDTELDNQAEVASWFTQSGITVSLSEEHPAEVKQHWGKQIISDLMRTHCNAISISSYDDYLKTYPIESCKAFEKSYEIQYVGNFDIYKEGIAAYQLFRESCENNHNIVLKNRAKQPMAEISCLSIPRHISPYMKLVSKTAS